MYIVNVTCNIALFIDSGLSGGAVAGIVIGVIVTFVAVSCACCCCYIFRKKIRSKADPEKKPLQENPEKNDK